MYLKSLCQTHIHCSNAMEDGGVVSIDVKASGVYPVGCAKCI